MTSQLSGTTTLFEDDFSTDGPLDSSKWDFNHYAVVNNPSFLGQTQMRQELPVAEGGIARIRLDTWLDGNAFSGSEAMTRQAFDVSGGGLAFEGKFRFEQSQGGMIAGFFTYQDFPPEADRNIHDELDYEIFTAAPQNISTNPYAQDPQGPGHAISYPVDGGTQIWHDYRIEWLPDMVRWFVDGKLLRTDTDHVPSNPQVFDINLWGTPTNWGYPFSDPTFVPAASADQNQTFFFDVDSVKIERLSTQLGDGANNTLVGTANNDGLSGGAGNDTISGLAGDDTIVGGAGDDTIDGGDGNDTAAYTGARASYDVSMTGNVLTVMDGAAGAASDGTDSLTHVEFLNFTDGLYQVNADGTLTYLPVQTANSGHGAPVGGGVTFSYAGVTGTVYADLVMQAGFIDGVREAFASPYKNLTGGSGTNTLVGDDTGNVLRGGPGIDYLYGQGGNDLLIGGTAPAGTPNQLWGGTGIDTVSYADATGAVHADLGALAGYVDGVLVDQMNAIENLIGGSGTNTLVGDGGDNMLTGGDGADYLYGQGGDDTLIGGAAPAGSPNQLWGGTGSDTASYAGAAAAVHADLAAQAGYVGGVLTDQMNSIENLTGGSQADTLAGDGGSNVLTGGGGADSLWGRGGADVFAYTAYSDSKVSGYDTIGDFVSGTSKLDLAVFNTDATHVLIVSDAQSTSLYLEKTPGTFDASSDLAISFVGANAIAMGDIKF
jgi:Ca2+-binding RTX toxin-like protein/beta-glucanase (GH16 family)